MRPARGPSLRRRLLVRMLAPALALAVVLGLAGALVIQDVVETTHDRLLDGSVLAIAERLGVEEDEVTVDLPRVALGMLESQAQDRIYYSVRYRGELVTGYRDLEASDVSRMPTGVTEHRDGWMHGAKVRIAAQARRVYGKADPILVQVAETREARQALTRRLLGGLVALEIGLLGLVGVLAWYSIESGLKPLAELSDEIGRRAVPGAISLQPLDVVRVPREAMAPVVAFNALLGRLDQALGSVRRFTADASHQMRTPLASLRTHIELLRRETARGLPHEATLQDIEGGARRLEHLLSQLIALARADERASTLASSSATVDLNEVVARVVAEQAPRALNADMEIELERPDEPLPIVGDAFLVGELLTNLLDNAIRYNRVNGTVVVRAKREASGAHVEIDDEGPGIPPMEREKVFERFHRVERKGGPEGSGLGLSIVRTLADKIGASVAFRDPPNNSGLRVEVVFRSAGRRK